MIILLVVCGLLAIVAWVVLAIIERIIWEIH